MEEVKAPQSLKITPRTTEARVGGAAVLLTATLEGLENEVVWTIVPEVGTLSNLTGLETSYTPPSDAATPTTVVITASAGDLSAFAFISLTSASVTRHVLYVNPEAGVDTNDGSESAPLRTIRRALTHAEEGTIVYLAGGEYSEASGETYLEVTDGQEGYLVPEGVEIAPDPNDQTLPVIIRNDAAPRDAFRFAGDGKLSGVRLEGFNRGLSATKGTQILNDVTMLSLNEFGVDLDGTARLSCTGCRISMARGVAFSLDDSTRLWVDGASSINTLSPENEPNLLAIYLLAGSQAEAVMDLGGGTSRTSHAVAGGKLTLRDVDVRLRERQGDLMIVTADGSLTIFDGRVSGGYFINGDMYREALTSNGTLTVNGTVFEGNKGGSLSLDGGSAEIHNAVFQNIGDRDAVFAGHGLYAVLVTDEVALRMRGTQIRNVTAAGNYTPPTPGTDGGAIMIGDASGGIDLGTEGSPGRNHFQDCGLTCLTVSQGAGNHTVQAVGNTWNPEEQGADEDGRYGPQLIEEGTWGSNFFVYTSLQL